MTTVLSHKGFESSSGRLVQPPSPSGLIETPGYRRALHRPLLNQGLCLRWHARTPLRIRLTVVPVPHGVQIEAIQLSHRSRGHELNY